jgi:NADH:ubiquinone oxidoreductase subunit 5 (subunit L)/multisubunit Na+/H+ antiporter MnhA subunit
MPHLAHVIPLLPLLAAVILGIGMLSGRLCRVEHEGFTAGVAKAAIYLAAVLALLLPDWSAPAEPVRAGALVWFRSGDFTFAASFASGGLHSWLCLVFALLFVVVFRFATQYMHREAGYHRFFFFLCLFAFASFLLVLSASTVTAFVAWEVAGISSWGLIAYNYRRAQAAANATRVFLLQRAGDAGFLLGLTLLLLWLGSADLFSLGTSVAALTTMQATLVALAFLLPACIKSAQFPFTPWIFRAMEGPTPSSTLFYGAVMIHSGVILLLFLQPVFERSLPAQFLLVVIGALTALYGYIVGRSQTDIKTSLGCATVTQTGLMFVECGLGLWHLALWHLLAHAIVRCFLFLRSPSILHHAHNLPVAPEDTPAGWLKTASLQQFWLDPLLDWALLRPVRRLAQDLTWFENHVLDPLMGSPGPVVRRMSSLLQQREGSIGSRLDNTDDSFAQGSGLAGKLTDWVALLSQWFEERFILQGVGRDMISLGRHLGHAANRFEQLLLRPRYLVVFILITLLVAM